MVNLETTNWLLGVMAVASAIQSIILIAVLVIGYRLYSQASRTMAELEVQHVEPLRRRVDGILADVERITSRVNNKTAQVDDAIMGTIERVDETAERVRDRVRERVSRATGIVRGVRAVIASLLTTEPQPKPPAAAGGRAY
jgi:uncharacterized protein YoxC